MTSMLKKIGAIILACQNFKKISKKASRVHEESCLRKQNVKKIGLHIVKNSFHLMPKRESK